MRLCYYSKKYWRFMSINGQGFSPERLLRTAQYHELAASDCFVIKGKEQVEHNGKYLYSPPTVIRLRHYVRVRS